MESTQKKQSNPNSPQEESIVAKQEHTINPKKNDSGNNNSTFVLKKAPNLNALQANEEKPQQFSILKRQNSDGNCLNTQNNHIHIKDNSSTSNISQDDVYKNRNCVVTDMRLSPKQTLHNHTIRLEHPEVLLRKQQKAKEKKERCETSNGKKTKSEKKDKSRSKSKNAKKRRGLDLEVFKKMKVAKKDVIKKKHG